MSSYKTVVVGTDGSARRCVLSTEPALASGPDAKVIVATASLPVDRRLGAADVLRTRAKDGRQCADLRDPA